jgi:carbonic anhydrase
MKQSDPMLFIEGHYDCGAVRASTKRQDLGELSLSLSLQCCCVSTSPLCNTSGLLDNWLRMIRDVYRIHKEHLDQIEDEEARHFQLVELNVIEQCLNLFKTGALCEQICSV